MKLHVKHTTDYRYTEPLRYALQTLWLTPLTGSCANGELLEPGRA